MALANSGPPGRRRRAEVRLGRPETARPEATAVALAVLAAHSQDASWAAL